MLLAFKLPKLKLLDATPISKKEREEAQTQGPNLFRMQRLMAEDDARKPKYVAPTTRSISPPKKPAAFLAKGHVRYNGTHSEGNRFILNNQL